MNISNLLKAKSEFRKKGVKLIADKRKEGQGGSWQFAGEDNFIKTVQVPLSEVGLEYIATMKSMPELNLNVVVGTLYHIESGEFIESSKILNDPSPRNDRNGNPMYLDAEIEAGKQFGYWSRILGIRLLGLSDIDPEDMNNRPENITDDSIAELKDIINKANNKNDIEKWLKDTFKIDSIDKITAVQSRQAINTLRQKSKK